MAVERVGDVQKTQSSRQAMKGVNQLVLCPEEMQVAMQEYIDKRMGNYAASVANVVPENNMSYSGYFLIVLKSASESRSNLEAPKG